MIEQITTYRTTDGEYFESKKTAVNYQREINRRAVIKKWVADNFGGVEVASVAEYAPDMLVVPLWQITGFIEIHGEFLAAVKKNMESSDHREIAGLLVEKKPISHKDGKEFIDYYPVEKCAENSREKFRCRTCGHLEMRVKLIKYIPGLLFDTWIIECEKCGTRSHYAG